ncbi:MAG: hypothetical protein AAFX93_12555 [Verrucomicrobiota bacterium]
MTRKFHRALPKLTALWREKGSALIAAFLFSMFVFVVLGSLMPMAVNDYESSVQNRLYNMAFAAAEAGADEVMWGMNNNRFDETAWIDDGWTEGKDFYGDLYWTKEILLPEGDSSSDDIFDGDHQAVIRVVVNKPSQDASRQEYSVYAKGVVTDTRTNRSAERIISFTAELNVPFRGLIVKNELDYNSLIDSYDSEVGLYGLPATNQERQNATAGTVSEDSDAIKVSFGPQTDIRGDLVTGTEDASNIDASKVKQITGQIQTGFTAEFPVITVPDTSDITVWQTSLN